MKHLFVSYEIAKSLKDKGFDEKCCANYWVFGEKKDNRTLLTPFDRTDLGELEDELGWAYHELDVPLYQQVIDWFREKHEIYISIDFFTVYEEGINRHTPRVYYPGFGPVEYQLEELKKEHFQIVKESFVDYYGALDKAITEALKLIP